MLFVQRSVLVSQINISAVIGRRKVSEKQRKIKEKVENAIQAL